jgi:hypothetical protein
MRRPCAQQRLRARCNGLEGRLELQRREVVVTVKFQYLHL